MVALWVPLAIAGASGRAFVSLELTSVLAASSLEVSTSLVPVCSGSSVTTVATLRGSGSDWDVVIHLHAWVSKWRSVEHNWAGAVELRVGVLLHVQVGERMTLPEHVLARHGDAGSVLWRVQGDGTWVRSVAADSAS